MAGELFIGGRWRPGSGAALTSTDPATGETVWEGATASGPDVAEAVASAHAAFRDWADRPRAARVEVVRRFKAELEARAEPMARDLSRETGKPLWETRAELASMAGKVEVSVAAAAERAGERENATAFGRAVLRHRPHGVAAVLGPFNFPGHLPNGHIVPALIAGDTVVFKPSEETPLAGRRMVEAWEAAGLPAGVLNLVPGGRETGAALVGERIDGLFFTGSADTGRVFRRLFVDRPEVTLALELGGDNPLIVWGAKDAEAAAALVLQSAFVTTGQRCSCARRLIVSDDRAGEAVVEALAALTARARIGAWDDAEEPFMGPLISARAARLAREAVGALDAAGARTVRPFARADDRSEAVCVRAVGEASGLRRRGGGSQRHALRPRRGAGQRRPRAVGPVPGPLARRRGQLEPADHGRGRLHALRRPGRERQRETERLLRRRLLCLSGGELRGGRGARHDGGDQGVASLGGRRLQALIQPMYPHPHPRPFPHRGGREARAPLPLDGGEAG